MKHLFLQLFTVSSLFAMLGLAIPQAQGGLSSQTSSLSTTALKEGAQILLFASIENAPAPTNIARKDKATFHELVQELQSLPVGKKYSYYPWVLEQRGYVIRSNYNDHRHWEFVLEKTRHVLRLTIGYNSGTRTSTSITASGPRVADDRS